MTTVITDDKAKVLEHSFVGRDTFYRTALGKAKAMANGQEIRLPNGCSVCCGVCGACCCGRAFPVPGPLAFTLNQKTYFISSSGSMDPWNDEAVSLAGLQKVNLAPNGFATGSPYAPKQQTMS